MLSEIRTPRPDSGILMWTVRPVPWKNIGLAALAIPTLLIVGTLLALQAATNVQLAAAMTSPVGASTLELAIGALLVAPAAVGGSLGALEGVERAEPWQLLGGLGSALSSPPAFWFFPASARWSRSVSSSPGRCSPRCYSTPSAGWGRARYPGRPVAPRRRGSAHRRVAGRANPGGRRRARARRARAQRLDRARAGGLEQARRRRLNNRLALGHAAGTKTAVRTSGRTRDWRPGPLRHGGQPHGHPAATAGQARERILHTAIPRRRTT
jgi:putative inner membrane exporter YdcZ